MRRPGVVLTGVAALTALVGRSSAHVRYVVEGDGSSIDPVEFLVTVLTDPANVALFAVGITGIALAGGGYLRFQSAICDIGALRTALGQYTDFLPWMLRLAVGLPLVGAGFAGYFFTPVVPSPTRFFQVGVGFLLLFGLATRAVAAIGLLAYLLGLAFRPELLLASEYVGGFLAIILLGSGRPSADHLLQQVADTPGTFYGRIDPIHRLARWFNRRVAPYEPYAPVLVRAAVGVNFAFLGLQEKLLQPGRALVVVEQYGLSAIVPVDPGVWVLGAGLTEFGIGVALLLGTFTRAVAAVAFVTLTLTLFGLPGDPVLAHVSLFGLSSFLFVTGAGPVSIDSRLGARPSPLVERQA